MYNNDNNQNNNNNSNTLVILNYVNKMKIDYKYYNNK